MATAGRTWRYIGQTVPVPVAAMLESVAEVVLLPVLGGVLANRLLGARLGAARPVFPRVSMGAVAVIEAVAAALNRERIPGMALRVAVPVVAHPALGLLGGCGAGAGARPGSAAVPDAGARHAELRRRGRAPAAVFSVGHNLSGSALAVP